MRWMAIFIVMLAACGGNLLERVSGTESAAQCYERRELAQRRFERVRSGALSPLFALPDCSGGLTHGQVFVLDRYCPGLLSAGQNVQVSVARCVLDARRALPSFLTYVGRVEDLAGAVNREAGAAADGIGSVGSLRKQAQYRAGRRPGRSDVVEEHSKPIDPEAQQRALDEARRRRLGR